MNGFVEISDLYKTFKIGKVSVPVLKGISLTISRGEWVALLGTSGSGKTTLLDLIGTISRPDSGSLMIDGKNMAEYSGEKLVAFRRKKIGFVFQSFHLLPELTILENTMLPALLDGGKKSKVSQKAADLLDHVGLSARIHHRPNELSGGEQQRVAIARALINDPELILADEPTGNLDSANGQSILNLFHNIHSDGNKTIIMVTHDPVVAAAADRKIILKDGVTVQE